MIDHASESLLRDPAYYAESPWKGTLRFDGGGALMNQGIHGVDILLYLAGNAKVLCAKNRTRFHSIEVEDVSVAMLEFENGAMGVIEATTCSNPGFYFYASHLVELCLTVFGWEPEAVTARNNGGKVTAILHYPTFDAVCAYTPECNRYFVQLSGRGDVILRWSFAPELEGADAFMQELNRRGVVASAGHSDAIYDDLLAAYQGGLRLITHMYSCTSTITREKGFRRLGVIEFAYLMDDVVVEAIADGCHIPKELFRLLYKIKGVDGICLVSDAMNCCGADTEFSSIGGVPCKIKNGVACLLDESAFAGSIATADRLVRFCVKDVGLSVCDAVKMMTAQNGAGILADVSYAIPDGVEFGLPYYWQFYIWGTKGTLRFSLNEAQSHYYLSGVKEPFLLEERENDADYLTDFCALVSGGNAVLPMEDVLRATRMTLQIQRKADTE